MGVEKEAVEEEVTENDVPENEVPENNGGAKQEARSDLHGPVAASDLDPPIRIVVHCLSHMIPGPRFKRITTMGNLICQHQFQRDMISGKDTIKVMGLQDIDGKKVRFHVESGTIPSVSALKDVPILAFKWTGDRLVSRDVDALICAYLRNLPFKHTALTQATKTSKSKTMLL